jgi:hypothetical protein
MPSTYTLNNGIELIATGEQSGTWGDTTNVNFSLIDTALDGQVTITLDSAGSSGSPNSLEITDGSSSNGRNRMLIFTDGGDLGASAFVQLTPNDAEKIFYVRNNLSGNRALLLFQGTYNAANDYEVPAGTTAVVFFNGGGAGAVAANVFNNAHFDSLNVVGNATVTGTATLASVEINGGTVDGAVIGGTTPAAISGTTGTFSGDFAVDTSVLFVDVSTNRVGVNTNAPTQAFDVSGNVQIQSAQPTLLLNDIDSTEDNKITAINSPSGELAFQYRDDALAGGGDYVRFPRSDNQMLGMEFLDAAVVKNFISTTGNSYFTSGNLGIGTNSPDSKFTVTNSAAGIADAIELENFTGDGSYIKAKRALVLSADWNNNAGGSQSYMAFETDGTERVRIDSSGNLGLKETNPSADLHISDASVVNVRLEETAGSSYTLIQTDTAGTLLSADPSNSRASTALRFALDGSERMRIDSSGNVGVGTTSPDEKLVVAGNIKTTGGVEVSGTIHSPVDTDSLRIYGGGDGDGANIGVWGSSHASNPNLAVLDADEHRFRSVGAVERMRITGAGNVGIGTVNPAAKLDVVGTVKATGLNLNGTAVTATAAELNRLDGITATTAELNYTDGVTSNIQTQLNGKASTSTSVSAGSGLTGGGTLAANRTISHADTSSQASVNNSGATVIQDVTLDTYGHVTALGSTTLSLSTFGVTSTAAELNKLDGFTGVVADLNYAKDLRATGVTAAEFDKLDGLTATTTELNYTDGVTSNIQTQLNSKMATSSYPDLVAIESLSSTGITVRTGTNTWAQRQILGGNGMLVTNNGGEDGDIIVNQTMALGQVGTYALLRVNSANDNTARGAASTLAGSALNYANCAGDPGTANPDGTWRLMGYIPASTTPEKNTSLWVRIS